MQDQEGFQTLKEIKDLFPDLPVIMISSNQEFLEFTELLGADGTLLKPINLKQAIELSDRFAA